MPPRKGGPGPARQLVFDLARAPSFASDEFLVSASNQAAFAAVQRWPDWPDRVLLLVGPAGSGKSHLAAIWALRAGAHATRGDEPMANLKPGHGSALVLEDCDRRRPADTDLFHLLNRVRETNGWLLITARSLPGAWGLATPDLLSRLRLAPIVTIGQPDMALLQAVLIKLFSDRQITIEEDVVTYAALHCDRSLDAVSRFVDAVDEDALAGGRRITRQLAAAAIVRLDEEKPALADEHGP